MSGKPFRPPMLRKSGDLVESSNTDIDTPPAKKRRISGDQEDSTKLVGPQLVFKEPGISSLPRKPLLAVKNPAIAAQATKPLDGGVEGYYNVLWRKYTMKKHKTWDGDGVLRIMGGYAYLQDISGRDMGRIPCNKPFLPGSELSIGGKEIEVDSVISKADFLAGRPFLKTSSVKPEAETKQVSLPKSHSRPDKKGELLLKKEDTKKTLNVQAPRSAASQVPFKGPLMANSVLPKKESKTPTPRHDPNAPNAIVMKRPNLVPKGKQIVDIVVDPLLTQHLREHQREGVKFMYECVMGMRDFDGQGAILADEMGLGKTLQTIALIWTLLKQNPIYEGPHDPPPVIKKALIVCPVTLINNWRKEFRKWLGADRLGVYVFDDNKKRISDFTKGKSYHVMIIGYEKLRNVVEELKKGHGIDIVIADEGHRLKTAKNKSAQAIKSLNTTRRVILSGTPIQNDLSEFFMMVDFVNPDLLGSFKTFTKEFETPILKSRQPGALSKDVEKGEARSEELASLTSLFILRRTADILSQYLPPKTEYILLCRPTEAQALTYQHVLACPAFQAALGNSEASLQLITVLKKVCNSPALLHGKALTDPSAPVSPLTASLLASVPHQLLRTNAGSTKLRALDQLLHTLRTTTEEKIILVSNYTSTLDLLQTLLTSLAHPYVRLDGSTTSSKRQDIVDTFNRSPASQCFAFLLSAKSGGVGLNLIGASRLVLFDVDWNPATDLQAMARIHRDGQKRPCVIYRFVMAGGIDEKIWQRQVTKLGLASNIMDQRGGTSSFTKDELRDLFRLDEGLSCQTHDLIGCACKGRGLPDSAVEKDFMPIEIFDSDIEAVDDDELPDMPALMKANKVNMDEQERKIRERASVSTSKKASAKMESLMAYSHIDTSKFATEIDEDMEAMIHDEVLLKVLKDDGNRVSFVFAKTSG
ncbi:DNA repair and recombination protein RAD54B, partial [Lecanoromycetidae sp. Uapishka_2]